MGNAKCSVERKGLDGLGLAPDRYGITPRHLFAIDDKSIPVTSNYNHWRLIDEFRDYGFISLSMRPLSLPPKYKLQINRSVLQLEHKHRTILWLFFFSHTNNLFWHYIVTNYIFKKNEEISEKRFELESRKI